MTVQSGYPGARLDLAGRIPRFARRVMVAGPGSAVLGGVLKRLRPLVVHGLVPGEQRAAAAHVLDAALEALPSPGGGGRYDVALLTDITAFSESPAELFQALEPLLSPHGCVMARLPNPVYWKRIALGGDASGPALGDVADAAKGAGFDLYAYWNAEDARFLEAPADPEGRVRLDAFTLSIPDDETRRAAGVIEQLGYFVRADYAAFNHATALFDAGDPAAAYEVLGLIPHERIIQAGAAITVTLEKQLCLLACLKNPPEDLPPLRILGESLRHFYDLTAAVPDLHAAYRTQAHIWRQMGNTRMAARILRSVLHIAPDEAAERQLAACGPMAPPRRDPAAGLWDAVPGQRLPKVLFITSPRPHYGQDVLYDGLCRVLGPENVVDFPAKPSLHGGAAGRYANYPCTFNWPDTGLDARAVADALATGHFDAVLYGDCTQSLEPELVRPLLANIGTPVYMVDEEDEPFDMRGRVMQHAGLREVAGCFKREFVAGGEYGPDTHPLPFAYSDALVGPAPNQPRERPLFWAGHRISGLRRLFIEHIERRFGFDLTPAYTQAEYARVLRQSRIGLNCFGYGFDTVRYWELPAHGCMLFSDRPPVVIPNNFVHGETAVFFDDLPDLEDKLLYYLENPEASLGVATAGHAHLLRYHTASARARQLLAVILGGAR